MAACKSQKKSHGLTELRTLVVEPLLYEGQRRRLEPGGGTEPAVAQPSALLALPALQVTLSDGGAVELRLDAPKHRANLHKFGALLQQLRGLAASDDAALAQLGRVEELVASEAGRANLEALWELFRRAVYSSQCEGRILTPGLLADALRALLEPHVARCEALLWLAGPVLGLAVLGAVEAGLQEVVERCERCERDVAGKDEALATMYGKLGFELRSLQALAVRFVAERQYARSPLLMPRDVAALRELLEQKGFLLADAPEADSVDALLWQLQEAPPASLEGWAQALEQCLLDGGEERRLLLSLGPAGQRSGGLVAVQSPEFLRAQEAALEVAGLAVLALDVSDRLRTFAPGLGRDAPPANAATAPGAAIGTPARLLGAAEAALSLVAHPVQLLRGARSPFMEGLLVGYGAVLGLLGEIERREAVLRLEEAEARASSMELACRDLQLQAVAQRKTVRDALRSNQQLMAVMMNVLEAQLGLTAQQRTCVAEASRAFHAATAALTAPELPDPLNPSPSATPRAGEATAMQLGGSAASSPTHAASEVSQMV